jgi:outer membrane protein assembly factor BamA
MIGKSLNPDRHLRQLLVFALLLALASCSTTKRLKENQYLLVKNEVKVTNPHKDFSGSDLESLIIQKPNKRFLGLIPFNLWFNSIFKKLGSPPVVLDRGLIEESKVQMGRYLNNSGFYNSSIEHEIDFKKKRARRVRYVVTLSKPYRILDYSFEIPDTAIASRVAANMNNSLVDTGNIFNTFSLDAERDRITKTLQNSGYFGFSKEYIFYEADSTAGQRQVNLVLNIKKFIAVDPATGDPMPPSNHKVYYIRNVTVNPDFRPFLDDSLGFDTLLVETNVKDPDTTDVFRMIYHEPLKTKPKLVARSLFVEPGEKYNATDASQSYRKLNEHRIFKYVDIKFREVPSMQSDSLPESNYLDCTINMTRNPVHSYSVEAQGTNSGGDLGLGGYLTYQNKNLFRGGEVFYVRVKGAIEAQETSASGEGEETRRAFFNTFEAGIEANLYIPKFLAPISEELFSKYFRPKTNINLGYNMQNRIEYDRIITNLSFGYEWSESRYRNHVLYPIDINVISVNTTPEFDEQLEQESERYRNQYTDHLILGLRYSYIFNNQEINRIRNFMYFRGNFEAAGNLLNLLMTTTGQSENEEGFQTLFNIRYSQYVKLDFDYRYYFMLDKNHSIALRGFTGVAIPYGNSIDIPFEKGYFGGGANGMRAWPLRYLGPGSYVKPEDKANDIERVGDIMFEANAEYRFPIYSFFTGALFTDIGNIWLINENETFPGGTLKFNNFFSELAIDLGIGVRLDFNYFIFRVDMAQRFRDPALPKADRWVIASQSDWFKPVLNLGIGYPF